MPVPPSESELLTRAHSLGLSTALPGHVTQVYRVTAIRVPTRTDYWLSYLHCRLNTPDAIQLTVNYTIANGQRIILRPRSAFRPQKPTAEAPA